LLAALVAVFILCIVPVVGAFAFLTPLLESYVSRSIQEEIGLAEAPEVDLRSEPSPDALSKRFEDGRVTLTDPELADGVRPEEVTVDLAPFDLDVIGSVAGGRARTEGPLSGTLRAELPEEEVAKIVSSATAAPVTDVELEEGYLIVGSEVEILGARFPVGWRGEWCFRTACCVSSRGGWRPWGSRCRSSWRAGCLEVRSLFILLMGCFLGGRSPGSRCTVIV
jgi:hypothetical protein